jgi:hypothetical protein
MKDKGNTKTISPSWYSVYPLSFILYPFFPGVNAPNRRRRMSVVPKIWEQRADKLSKIEFVRWRSHLSTCQCGHVPKKDKCRYRHRVSHALNGRTHLSERIYNNEMPSEWAQKSVESDRIPKKSRIDRPKGLEEAMKAEGSKKHRKTSFSGGPSFGYGFHSGESRLATAAPRRGKDEG